MKKILSLLSAVFLTAITVFSQTAKELQETARSFMQQGDYSNAVLVLNRASQLAPTDIDISKDLALSYYLQKDLEKALGIVTPLLDREDADDQCYQIASNIYKQMAAVKDCDRLLRRGIKRFPTSGAMYNELGELLLAQQNFEAITQWEKGIEVDPSYARNYYNACKHYYLASNNVWCILYGETFINLEPFSNRTIEIKDLLLDSYKKLFANVQVKMQEGDKSKFAEAFVKVMNKQNIVAGGGISPEVLTMIRTRFILDWYNDYGNRFPFKLFEQHRQLLQEGMFDAYNQWLFGSVQNLPAYQNWTLTHASENDEFVKFQRGRVFKVPGGQYYH